MNATPNPSQMLKLIKEIFARDGEICNFINLLYFLYILDVAIVCKRTCSYVANVFMSSTVRRIGYSFN